MTGTATSTTSIDNSDNGFAPYADEDGRAERQEVERQSEALGAAIH